MGMRSKESNFGRFRNPPHPSPGKHWSAWNFSPINFNDLMVVWGIYAWKPELPATMGNEGAGKVIAVGEGVTSVNVGDRTHERGPVAVRQAVGDAKSLDAFLVGQQLDGSRPVSSPHTAIEAKGVEDAEQRIPDVLVGVSGRFVQNRTLGCKPNEISGVRKRSFAHKSKNRWISARNLLSKPSFKIDPNGNRHVKWRAFVSRSCRHHSWRTILNGSCGNPYDASNQASSEVQG